MARCRCSASTSTSETSMPWSAACCAICAPMVPAPTTRRRPSAAPALSDGVIRSDLVRPPDRDARRAVGELLRCLRVSDDRGEVALELQPPQHDALGRVELLLSHLLPARVGAGDHELGLLRILTRADADIARLTVPEVEEDPFVIRKVLVGLGEDDQTDGPLPTGCRLLVHGRLVDLRLECVSPFGAVRVDGVGVCHCSAS